MTQIKSLYFRMRSVHMLGILILIVNAIVLTQAIWSSVIQLVLAGILFWHDWDEKHWGGAIE